MTFERAEWFNDAACATTDPDIFFPEIGDSVSGPNARTICHHCDTRTACLEYAINNRITDGIWGGVTARTRRRIIEQRNKETV